MGYRISSHPNKYHKDMAYHTKNLPHLILMHLLFFLSQNKSKQLINTCNGTSYLYLCGMSYLYNNVIYGLSDFKIKPRCET